MVQNAIANELRRLTAQRRDVRRRNECSLDLGFVPSDVDQPDELAERRELIERVVEFMNRRERQVWQLVQAGLKWSEIGRQLGIGTRAARMRYRRTITRLRGIVRKAEWRRRAIASGSRNRIRKGPIARRARRRRRRKIG